MRLSTWLHALRCARPQLSPCVLQAGARPGTRDSEDRTALEYAEAARYATAVTALARAEDAANGGSRGMLPGQDTPRAGPLGVAGGFEILGPARRPLDLSLLGAEEEALDGGYDGDRDPSSPTRRPPRVFDPAASGRATPRVPLAGDVTPRGGGGGVRGGSGGGGGERAPGGMLSTAEGPRTLPPPHVLAGIVGGAAPAQPWDVLPEQATSPPSLTPPPPSLPHPTTSLTTRLCPAFTLPLSTLPFPRPGGDARTQRVATTADEARAAHPTARAGGPALRHALRAACHALMALWHTLHSKPPRPHRACRTSSRQVVSISSFLWQVALVDDTQYPSFAFGSPHRRRPTPPEGYTHCEDGGFVRTNSTKFVRGDRK